MTSSLDNTPPFLQKRLREYDVNGFIFQTVLVEKGSFIMGNRAAKSGKKPVLQTTVRADFELGITPVTQGLWRAVMGSDWPEASFIGDERPVQNVSWYDIRGSYGFLKKLNAWLLQSQQVAQGTLFCLPSEVQWEYAARGGRYHVQAEHEYAGSSRLIEVGWYHDNSGEETHDIAQKYPNLLGLYDMNGNVWEWVEDDQNRSSSKPPLNDAAWIDSPRGRGHVRRGGSWFSDMERCRVSCRRVDPVLRSRHFGFRLARSLSSL